MACSSSDHQCGLKPHSFIQFNLTNTKIVNVSTNLLRSKMFAQKKVVGGNVTERAIITIAPALVIQIYLVYLAQSHYMQLMTNG